MTGNLIGEKPARDGLPFGMEEPDWGGDSESTIAKLERLGWSFDGIIGTAEPGLGCLAIGAILAPIASLEQEALMAERMVKCVKLQRELPGLDKPPFSDALGQKIYENVSKEGWRMFKEHFKMVMNEYRLALGTDEANQIFEKQVEEYFFGPGSTLPPGYIPPKPN